MSQHASSSLLRAGNWFLTSGIQEESGGVARYHRLAEERNLAVSTEITGYAASAFAYLFSQTQEPLYREAAHRCARFLSRQAWQESIQAMPFELGNPLPPAYFFDCGIIIRGLLAVFRLTGEEEYLQVARKTGLFMHRAFANADGRRMHPIVHLPNLEPEPYAARWSREPSCFQLKSAMAWDDLAKFFPNEPFVAWYEQQLAYALETYETFLPGSAEELPVMDRLHAFSYFLEGMLPRANRPEVQTALRQGIGLAESWLRRLAPRFERSDVNGQLLRARLYAEALGAVPLDLPRAEEENARCLAHQVPASEPAAMRRNGFVFGSQDGKWMPFMNPVSTAFCMQAVHQFALRQQGQFLPVVEELI